MRVIKGRKGEEAVWGWLVAYFCHLTLEDEENEVLFPLLCINKESLLPRLQRALWVYSLWCIMASREFLAFLPGTGSRWRWRDGVNHLPPKRKGRLIPRGFNIDCDVKTYMTYNVLFEQTQEKWGIIDMFSGGATFRRILQYWVKVIGLHVSAVASHVEWEKMHCLQQRRGRGAISKVMPSLSQESMKILFRAPACIHIARHLCGRIIPEHVSVKSEFKKMAHRLWHSCSRPWDRDIWKVKGWTRKLLRMFSQHYQVLETQ